MSKPNIRNIFGSGALPAATPSSSASEPTRVLDPSEEARADAENGRTAPIQLPPDTLVALLLSKAGLEDSLVEKYMECHMKQGGAAMRATGSLIISTLAELPTSYTVQNPPKAAAIREIKEHYSTNALLEALRIRLPGKAEMWLPSYAPWKFLDGMRGHISSMDVEMKSGRVFLVVRIRSRAGTEEVVWVPDPLCAKPEEIEHLVHVYNMHSGQVALLAPFWIEEIASLMQMITPFEQAPVRGETGTMRVVMGAPARIREAQKHLPECLFTVDKVLGRCLIPQIGNMLEYFTRHLGEVYMPQGKVFEPQVYIAMRLTEVIAENREARATFDRNWPQIVNACGDWYKQRCESKVVVRACASFEPDVEGKFALRDEMYPSTVAKKDEFDFVALRDYMPPSVIQHLAECRLMRSLGERDQLLENVSTVGVTGEVPMAQIAELAMSLYQVGWKAGEPLTVIGPSNAQIPSLQTVGAKLYDEVARGYAGVSIAPAPAGSKEFDVAVQETTAWLSSDPAAGNNTSSAQASVRCAWAMTHEKQMVAAHALIRSGAQRIVFGTFLPYEEMAHTFLRDNPVWGPLAEHFDLEVCLSAKLHSDRVFLCGTRRVKPIDADQLEHWYRSRLFWIGAIVRAANDHVSLVGAAGGLRWLPNDNLSFQRFILSVTSYGAACIRAIGFSFQVVPVDAKSAKLPTTSDQRAVSWFKPLPSVVAQGPVRVVAHPSTQSSPVPPAAKFASSVTSTDWRELHGPALEAAVVGVKDVAELEAYIGKREAVQVGVEALLAQHVTPDNIRASRELKSDLGIVRAHLVKLKGGGAPVVSVVTP